SLKPAATTRLRASTRRVAEASPSGPTAAILPSRTPTSATNQGAPVPSTTRPPAKINSKRESAWGEGKSTAKRESKTAPILFMSAGGRFDDGQTPFFDRNPATSCAQCACVRESTA